MFSGCTVPPDSEETEFGSSDQEVSSSASKNTGVASMPCCTWKCDPASVSDGVDIFEVLGCRLLEQMSFY